MSTSPVHCLRSCTPAEAANIIYPVVRMIIQASIVPTAKARDPERTGGWFAFWRMKGASGTAVPVVGFPVGEVSAERFMKYMFFANEKAMRLDTQRTHISSWQSRDTSDPDPLKRKYGGAIHIPVSAIFSFSGFSEHEDELICAEAARQLQMIEPDRLQRIIAASDNALLRDHLESVHYHSH